MFEGQARAYLSVPIATKLFLFITDMLQQNKLVCLSAIKFVCLSPMFVSKDRANLITTTCVKLPARY